MKGFVQAHGRLPTFSEAQKLLGYRSKGGVSNLMAHLARHRFVEKDRHGKRVPTSLLKSGLKLLGAVQAGFPSPAEEELIDTLSLDEFLVPNREASYLVKVTGDSMIEAGIFPDDLIIVERGRSPKSGDIVIAQIDGEWTLKYFEKTAGGVVLRPANKKYPPLYPKGELIVAGVVVANVRKYR
ncbi:MAG TPA: S24 family peptidase [Verrucomicrobiae bacterium]|nr:S24 family peptidase [Verrucomicrobiae bacterium]